jgi:hypothetical protein
VTHEQAFRIIAKLYEVRDHAKRVLGDKYRARMEEGGKLLSGIAEAKGCCVTEVALNASQAAARKGDMSAVGFILAAAVELLEPSEDVA